MKSIEWRAATKDDLPRVKELHGDLERMLGREFDLPDVSKRPVVMCMLAERDGKVIGGFYTEINVELCFFGTDPRVTAAVHRVSRPWINATRQAGARLMRCFVPKELADKIKKPLNKAGFQDVSEKYSHFAQKL